MPNPCGFGDRDLTKHKTLLLSHFLTSTMPTFYVTEFHRGVKIDTYLADPDATDLQTLISFLLQDWVDCEMELWGVFSFLRDNGVTFPHTDVTRSHPNFRAYSDMAGAGMIPDDVFRDDDFREWSEADVAIHGVFVSASNAVQNIVSEEPGKLQEFITAVSDSVRISVTCPPDFVHSGSDTDSD